MSSTARKPNYPVGKFLEGAYAPVADEREVMFEDVYVKPPWHISEQREELAALPSAPSGH